MMIIDVLKINTDGTEEIVQREVPDDWYEDAGQHTEPDTGDMAETVKNAVYDELANAYRQGVNSI